MPGSASAARRVVRTAVLVLAVAALSSTNALAAHAAKQPKQVVQITTGDATLYKVGNDPAAFPDDVRAGVLATLTGYVNAATVTPLRKGKADDTALAGSLAPSVFARLTGPDRSVLVDEGLPKSVSKIVVRSTPITLAGLADGDGRIIVVTANLDSTTTTKTTKGKVSIKRTGELVLTPDGGTWKISGYNLAVDRLGKGVPSSTATTVPGATPATTAPAGAR